MAKTIKKKTSAKKKEVVFTPELLLKQAKKLGLFKHNPRYKQYEIILPLVEYEKL